MGGKGFFSADRGLVRDGKDSVRDWIRGVKGSAMLLVWAFLRVWYSSACKAVPGQGVISRSFWKSSWVRFKPVDCNST